MNTLNTLFFLLAVLSTNLPCLSQTFHAMLVADTGDPNEEFAEICSIDLEKMKKETTEMAYGIGYQPNTVVVARKDFTSAQLLAAIESMQVQPDRDVVFFYYSGAALCNQMEPDSARTLQLGRDSKDLLSTTRIMPLLESKQARLLVAVVDGCALIRSVRADGIKRGAALNKVYQTLFAACGSVKLFSSQCSEFSYGNTQTGSIFTNAFVEALDKFINMGTQNLTWEELFKDTYSQTLQQAQRDIFRPQHAVMFEGRLRKPCNSSN